MDYVNENQIKLVDEYFRGSGAKSLWKEGRTLLGQGSLTKLCRKGPQRRQFFLFNDILVYASIKVPLKKYVKQRIISLDDARLVPIDDDDFKNGWIIYSADKSFVVYAETERDKKMWVNQINLCLNAISDHTMDNLVSKKDPNYSPVWVPDNSAAECMLCKKTKFTQLTRRHHCRNCGMVVCYRCSSNRHLLKHQSDKPKRVCDNCYVGLAEEYGKLEICSSDSSGSDLETNTQAVLLSKKS